MKPTKPPLVSALALLLLTPSVYQLQAEEGIRLGSSFYPSRYATNESG